MTHNILPKSRKYKIKQNNKYYFKMSIHNSKYTQYETSRE